MLLKGAAGMADMRSARPFDKKGFRSSLQVPGTENDPADKWGTRGSTLVSKTWGDSFGLRFDVNKVTKSIQRGLAFSAAAVSTAPPNFFERCAHPCRSRPTCGRSLSPPTNYFGRS